jgi:hypothetical protein
VVLVEGAAQRAAAMELGEVVAGDRLVAGDGVAGVDHGEQPGVGTLGVVDRSRLP